MQKLEVRLRFLTPCLGHVRTKTVDHFELDTHGNVVFMNSWWRRLFEYGAQAYGKHQTRVRRINVRAAVTGETGLFDRYYRATQYKRHEAFTKDSVITVQVMLPDGIPEDEFLDLLDLAGQYRGISPYGWEDGYGRFEVVREQQQQQAEAPDEE